MDDMISRQALIKDAESWTAVDEHERHLQKNVIEWLKEFPSALSTNLAEVGTDCISRQAAIDAINKAFERVFAWDGTSPLGDKVLENVPSAQPEQHLCRDCKWAKYYGNVDKNGNVESYWYCTNWYGGTDEEGYCHEWESR